MDMLAQESLLRDLLLSEPWGMIIVSIVAGCGVAVVSIISGAIATTAKARAREQTRREIAAYVAEGSIQPDDAVAMMNAGRPKSKILGIACCGSDAKT